MRGQSDAEVDSRTSQLVNCQVPTVWRHWLPKRTRDTGPTAKARIRKSIRPWREYERAGRYLRGQHRRQHLCGRGVRAMNSRS